MMFLKQVPGPKPPEDLKHKAHLQKRKKTQHLLKAYPPPVLIFQAKNTHNLPQTHP